MDKNKSIRRSATNYKLIYNFMNEKDFISKYWYYIIFKLYNIIEENNMNF